MKVLVTGDNHPLPKLAVRGESVEWLEVPVLSFERLEVDGATKSRLFSSPPDWIVFTSRRTVEAWKSAMGGLPGGSRLAAIGAATANALGGAVAFVPSRAGSEAFLREFPTRHSVSGTSFLLPGAEEPRPLLATWLEGKGGRVEKLPLYHTSPRNDVRPVPVDVSAVLFTSPSSVEAVLAAGPLPEGVRVLSLGEYTSECLRSKGFKGFREVPNSDFARIGEIL